jgi:Tol biopolymer transport system component
MRSRGGVVAIALCAALAVPGGALAQRSASNGKIAFEEETFDAPVAPRLMTTDPSLGSQPAILDLATWTDPAPSWSPDGSHIVFARAIDSGFLADLWTVDASLGHLTQLTDTPTIAEGQPAWSPDGRRIAYTADGRIRVLDLATDTSVPLSPPGATDDTPAWSPDGSKIAFSRGDFGSREIYVMDSTTGAGATRLTFDRGDNNSPAWSPNGQRIAWSSGNAGTLAAEIWVARADGRGAHALTHNHVPDLSPSWSPDGLRIAFQRTDVNAPLFPDYIWTMDRNGQNRQQLALGQQPDWGRAPTG